MPRGRYVRPTERTRIRSSLRSARPILGRFFWKIQRETPGKETHGESSQHPTLRPRPAPPPHPSGLRRSSLSPHEHGRPQPNASPVSLRKRSDGSARCRGAPIWTRKRCHAVGSQAIGADAGVTVLRLSSALDAKDAWSRCFERRPRLGFGRYLCPRNRREHGGATPCFSDSSTRSLLINRPFGERMASCARLSAKRRRTPFGIGCANEDGFNRREIGRKQK